MSVICFFKQKTAYELRISDWSSDVDSSDLALPLAGRIQRQRAIGEAEHGLRQRIVAGPGQRRRHHRTGVVEVAVAFAAVRAVIGLPERAGLQETRKSVVYGKGVIDSVGLGCGCIVK